MHDKEKLATYIDITKQTIAICWIALFSFCAIKLFSGNFFEILVENENFVKFSELVQNTWLKYIVSFFTIGIAKYFTFGAICQKFYFKGKDMLIIGFCILSIWAGVNFLNSDFIKMWYAYILYIIIALIYQKGCKKLFGILAIVFEFLFASLSMLVRNLELQVMTDYLITSILIIDVNIMIVLYYLYSNLIKLNKEKT